MGENWCNEYICVKQDIDDKDFVAINDLERICTDFNDVNLKLELEFKLSIRKKHSSPLKGINEFLYYVDNNLIGYLGVSNFGGPAAEINGMVHPEWRRKGIFTRLYALAKQECNRIDFKKILLLSDHKSDSGKAFIKNAGAEFSFSEYKMKLGESNNRVGSKSIDLRKARNSDGEELARLDCIFFGEPNIQLTYPEEEEKSNRITYIIEHEKKIIGKIRIESQNEQAYIYGFGVLPEFRGRGYGREALELALNLIKDNNIYNVYLDVASENGKALNLYKSCGFIEQSIMNYYIDK